ncbi:hypothetical protein [Maioricimonas rarisocia]|uniref:hypothetical protein n=1 Tax=Maioricimonas rarisocia TaxID=2528026 RepID=UPI0011A5A14E|nr:hypothetical protein [Maioricimonas rarisocia]
MSLHPHDPHVLRSVAAFYLRSRQREAAETLLWKLVDPAADVPPADRDWASRQLAGGTGEESI